MSLFLCLRVEAENITLFNGKYKTYDGVQFLYLRRFVNKFEKQNVGII